MIDRSQYRILIDKYLDSMDNVQCGEGKLFKEESQKADLETKIWHFLYKIEAAEYHKNRVKGIAQSMRDELKNFMNKDVENHFNYTNSARTKEVENTEILYEVDAFFTTSRSVLDFLASILSRYMKGKQTDKIRDFIKILRKSQNDFAIKNIAIDMWDNWGQDLIEYRDYLVHSGSLHSPKAIATKTNRNISNGTIDEKEILMNWFSNKKEEYIVFPLPKKPNKSLRITRMNNWYEREVSEMPEGFSKEESYAMWQSGNEKHESRRIRYTLDIRYFEADELCATYYNQLIEFSSKVINELLMVNFKFLL